jgi:hypothetical protein
MSWSADIQIAGDGNILNQIFAPASSNWGPTSPIHLYKHKAAHHGLPQRCLLSRIFVVQRIHRPDGQRQQRPVHMPPTAH